MTTIQDEEAKIDRRRFLTRAGAVGLGIAGTALIAGCGGSSSSGSSSTNSNDNAILGAAIIAETLAVTMYTNLIASPIVKVSLAGNQNDVAYFTAALQEEQIHLNALVMASGQAITTKTFYFPQGMFSNSSVLNLQTTMNTLLTLEDAFIAAYLLGVQQFSSAALRLVAARIMGNESDHRVLARVVAADLGLPSVTGFNKVADSPIPANDIAFERTFDLTNISQVVTALTPFITAGSAGFGTTAYNYTAATINNPNLNDINS